MSNVFSLQNPKFEWQMIDVNCTVNVIVQVTVEPSQLAMLAINNIVIDALNQIAEMLHYETDSDASKTTDGQAAIDPRRKN